MKQRTLKLQRIYKEGSAYLESRQIPDAQIDAWYLLEYVTGISTCFLLWKSGKKYFGRGSGTVCGDCIWTSAQRRIPLAAYYG